MYNNEVTYNKKWETEENQKALGILKKKFFDRSECCPDCPTGWAPEVLELLEELDREFGIARNTRTLAGYIPQGKWYVHLTVGPLLRLLKLKNPKYIPSTIGHSYSYGFKMFKAQVINPLINKFLKPKITIGQIKEKFGSFTFYFSAPDYLRDHIDHLVSKTIVKLAIKGCYYPVESLYNANSNWNVGNEWHVDDITTKTSKDSKGGVVKTIYKYSYRKPMKELGLNLDTLKIKSNTPKRETYEDRGVVIRPMAKVGKKHARKK